MTQVRPTPPTASSAAAPTVSPGTYPPLESLERGGAESIGNESISTEQGNAERSNAEPGSTQMDAAQTNTAQINTTQPVNPESNGRLTLPQPTSPDNVNGASGLDAPPFHGRQSKQQAKEEFLQTVAAINAARAQGAWPSDRTTADLSTLGPGSNHSGQWRLAGSSGAFSPVAALTQWFGNLPIGRKQILALLICELVPILGLGLGSVIIITQGFRSQLVEQAKSEAAVSQIGYNLKIDQMGFGSRGQSDNTAIIQAAKTIDAGEALDGDLKGKVRQILENEVKARNMEFATLVSSQRKIIANANRDLSGLSFDPGKLVSFAQQQGVQVKATLVVPAGDLLAEGVELPPGFQDPNALIRFVVTPVRDPETKGQIGVLIFGDMVNRKPDAVIRAINALGSGYNGIYLYDSRGDRFDLSTALYRQPQISEDTPPRSLPLPEEAQALLHQAARAKGQPITQRLRLDGRMYTLAARAVPNQVLEQPGGAVPNFADVAPAVLVRGTPEDKLDELLRRSLSNELVVLLLSIGLIGLWSGLFRRLVLRPLLSLERTAQRFAEGDRDQRAEVFYTDEVGQLTRTFNRMADSLSESETTLANEARRQQTEAHLSRQLNDIITQMRESLEEQRVLNAAVRGVRQALDADRVVVFQFDEGYYGNVVAESVTAAWPTALGSRFEDPCFAEQFVEAYSRGRVHQVADLQTATLGDCYLQELSPFQVRANLVVPILLGDAGLTSTQLHGNQRLLGLLCIHQCSGPRDWQGSEVGFARQVASQLGYALEQARLFGAKESSQRTTERLLSEQKQYSQTLQLQLLELLGEVEGAASGDLTVRANVTAGEIGTVADFFNSIVESLRQIVTQVKDASTEVNQSIGANETSIRELASESLRQAQDIETALASVEGMTQSIQAVAHNATQAAEISRQAATTAAASGIAMDHTVHNILTLRETIGETAKKVKRLGESSQQISKVVFLINQIATQTNLLAINAGIEAARAGERGEGFAVVAEEIGELATRSATATQEIEQLVEAIQRETSEVVQAMELGTTQVVEGTRLVDQTKGGLSNIVRVSQQIDGLVNSISEATVSQADTSQAITQLMQELAAIAQKTSQSSLQVSNSLRQTVEVARDLQTSVEAFKVN